MKTFEQLNSSRIGKMFRLQLCRSVRTALVTLAASTLGCTDGAQSRRIESHPSQKSGNIENVDVPPNQQGSEQPTAIEPELITDVNHLPSEKRDNGNPPISPSPREPGDTEITEEPTLNGSIDTVISNGWVSRKQINKFGSARPVYGKVAGVLSRPNGQLITWDNYHFITFSADPAIAEEAVLSEERDHRNEDPFYSIVASIDATTGTQLPAIEPVMLFDSTNLYSAFLRGDDVLIAGTTRFETDGLPHQHGMIFDSVGMPRSRPINFDVNISGKNLLVDAVAVTENEYFVCGIHMASDESVKGTISRYQFRPSRLIRSTLLEDGSDELECLDMAFHEASDTVFVGAVHRATQRLFVLKLSSLGVLLWKISVDNVSRNKVVLSVDQDRLLVGYSIEGSGDPSAAVRVLDLDGNSLCTLGDLSSDEHYAKGIAASGDVLYTLVSIPIRGRGASVVISNQLVLYRSRISTCEASKESFGLSDTLRWAGMAMQKNRIYVYGSDYNFYQPTIRELILSPPSAMVK